MEPTVVWAPPAELSSTLVLPDFHDCAPAAGKESNPTLMGIFLCLLDDRPHLHPTLQALNVHRARVHQLPALDPTLQQGHEWAAWRLSDTEEARRAAYLPHA